MTEGCYWGLAHKCTRWWAGWSSSASMGDGVGNAGSMASVTYPKYPHRNIFFTLFEHIIRDKGSLWWESHQLVKNQRENFSSENRTGQNSSVCFSLWSLTVRAVDVLHFPANPFSKRPLWWVQGGGSWILSSSFRRGSGRSRDGIQLHRNQPLTAVFQLHFWSDHFSSVFPLSYLG